MTVRLLPAILSGGSGTRLWPLSTEAEPKQFHALCSDQTMLQDTLRRLAAASADIDVLPPILICSDRHRAAATEQMREIAVHPAAIVLEPMGRNSAPAAVAAARLALEVDPDALVILMAADHHIADSAGFAEAVARACASARENIVTFGVAPTRPETGYGYIEGGEPLDGPVRKVVRFAEKPDLATAEAYVADGRHLWNAGIFLFSPQVLLAEMERFAPDVVAATDLALARARRDGATIALDAEAFGRCPSISIDYAVMEKTDRAAVTPIGVDWADVGSWSELWRLGPRDGQGNFLKGDALVIDASDTLVWAASRTVGVIGVKDLVVVETEEAVLVLPRDRAQDVKLLVEQIKARGGK
jgi:mannose-1-phosphate guanylyltransferase/mannose-1-phosphate guanylyltransferase/mannose-6-phosphate isomerase